MAKFGSTPSPAGTAAPPDDEKTPPSKGAKFNETLNDHHKKIHLHLKQAHAAAGNNPAVARHHINQAGIAATAMHKTAKEAANANGLQDDANDYSAQGDNYQGQGSY